MRDQVSDSTAPRQERHRSWRGVFAAACALLPAAAVVLLAALILVLPSYLSGRHLIDITFQVISAPEDAGTEITDSSEAGPGLSSLSCVFEPADSPDLAGSLKCRFIAAEVIDGTQYLTNRGFVLGDEYADFSVRPASGEGWSQAIVLLFGMGMWAAWLHLFRHSLATDLRRARSFLRNRGLLALLPCLFTLATVLLVAGLSGTEAQQPRVSVSTLGWVVLMSLVVAPIFEEAVFRGIVHDVLRRHMRWWIAAIPGSAGFAAMHILPSEVSAAGYAAYLVFGFSLCWLREVSSSLTLCVLAHALYNALILLLAVILPLMTVT